MYTNYVYNSGKIIVYMDIKLFVIGLVMIIVVKIIIILLMVMKFLYHM